MTFSALEKKKKKLNELFEQSAIAVSILFAAMFGHADVLMTEMRHFHYCACTLCKNLQMSLKQLKRNFQAVNVSQVIKTWQKDDSKKAKQADTPTFT